MKSPLWRFIGPGKRFKESMACVPDPVPSTPNGFKSSRLSSHCYLVQVFPVCMSAYHRYLNDYCQRIIDERRSVPIELLQGRPDYVSRLLCSKKVGVLCFVEPSSKGPFCHLCKPNIPIGTCVLLPANARAPQGAHRPCLLGVLSGGRFGFLR
jgi:hypothetical protein